MRRESVHRPDPFDAVYLAKRPYQGRESIDLAEVLTVARRVLCDQHDLFDALFGEHSGFFDDRAEPPRAKRASHRRYRAKRTWAVAALGDLDESGVRLRRPHPRRVFVVKIGRRFVADRRDRELAGVKLFVGGL